MGRQPTLSPTKITTYLACPTKYFWTYVDQRGRWYVKSKSYYSFGTTLHAVLQRFHDSKDTGVTTVGEAVSALEESWIDAGYSSQDEMMQAMAEGKAIVESYVERREKEVVTAQTMYVEKLVRRDLGPFALIGRVDRVDEHEDGTLEVIDYKSGRLEVSEEDVKHDLAMNCYQVIMEGLFPDRQIVSSIIALRSGKRATARLTAEESAEFLADITRLGTVILDLDWEGHSPQRKPLCERCDFVPLCKKSPGYDQ